MNLVEAFTIIVAAKIQYHIKYFYNMINYIHLPNVKVWLDY